MRFGRLSAGWAPETAIPILRSCARNADGPAPSGSARSARNASSGRRASMALNVSGSTPTRRNSLNRTSNVCSSAKPSSSAEGSRVGTHYRQIAFYSYTSFVPTRLCLYVVLAQVVGIECVSWYASGKKKGPIRCPDRPSRVFRIGLRSHEQRRRGNRNGDQRRANAHRRNRRDHELAPIPRRDDRRCMVRQRRHDLRFHVLGRAHASRAIHLIVHRSPEFYILHGITLPDCCFRQLAVEPRMDAGRERVIRMLPERNLAFDNRTNFVIALLFRRALVPVATIARGAGIQVVMHVMRTSP